MTKHRMFGAPNLRQSKNFTQPLVVMVETFRMSGSYSNECLPHPNSITIDLHPERGLSKFSTGYKQ